MWAGVMLCMGVGGAIGNEVNEAARLLAGLPLQEGSAYAGMAQLPEWVEHKTQITEMFQDAENYRLQRMREWSATEVFPRVGRKTTIFYFFGGPDFLSVGTLLPASGVYILAGLEPVGTLPDVRQVDPMTLDASLDNLRYSLRSLCLKGFFETKEMREDLQKTSIQGVLPLLTVFLVRTGHEIQDITLVQLDANGHLAAVKDGGQGRQHGVQIGFRSAAGGGTQYLYYFSTDLSNGGLGKDARFLKFCERYPDAGSYLKAASYLMHQKNFSRVKEFLLDKSAFVLQDESGIPIRDFATDQWALTFYGAYVGPMDIFKEYEQKEMWEAYSRPEQVLPLGFGTGYRRHDHDSNQILAVKRSAAAVSAPRALPVTP